MTRGTIEEFRKENDRLKKLVAQLREDEGLMIGRINTLVADNIRMREIIHHIEEITVAAFSEARK